jgi:hypothetical protein
MKVGDLVKASHWDENQTGIIISVDRLETGIVKVLGSFGWELDQVARNLEVISESR